MASTLRTIHREILSALQNHPEGLSIAELRYVLGLSSGEQNQLGRRVRELDDYYHIRRDRKGNRTVYVLEAERDVPREHQGIDQVTRARILHIGGYKCQSCGRNPTEDSVKLHIDHKIPRSWGGSNSDENLWVLCSECNQGKRNFFARITDARIQEAMLHPSVHVRIGELLKTFHGEPVPKEHIAVVAFTHDDFERRLRELRTLGWEYHSIRRKVDDRVKTSFVLTNWEPWPENPAATIRAIEGSRSKRE